MSNYNEQFLKQNPLAVLGVLRDLKSQQVPLRISWSGGQFISKVLAVSPDELVMDFGSQEYENQAVFTYVEQLLQGNLSDEYNIATFASKHNQIDTKLKELKNIIIKYYPEKENTNLLNAVLFDIFNCEQDLATHCQVEDYMFVPAVAQIEKRLKDEQEYFSENSCCRNFGHCTKWSCGSAQTHSQSECAPHRGVVTGSIAELYTSAHSRYCNRKPYFRRLVRPALFQDKP